MEMKMKLSKIVDKVKKYLEKDNLKVSQEKKLLNIIEELENKKSKIKDELKNIDKDNIKKRVELEKKYNAVSKVLKKSRSIL
jgi:thioredoxin reductase